MLFLYQEERNIYIKRDEENSVQTDLVKDLLDKYFTYFR